VTGTKLGNYEILDKLGEGGMGQVWRARDARLSRSVAIKVLPAEMAGDPARRQRFEQEARALGALNHPNIVAIYDVGQNDGRAYLVSELVVGESLREVVERGPMPPRKVVELGTQMAEALSAAHALGIIHRDLKPENVMIARDGRVKVLDFGLAKQNVPAAAGENTATMLLSQAGVVLGTVGYMSPEQVRGEPVDARSDIFSLGCVLYEMAAGARAFDGKSAADVMSAILKEEPPEMPASTAALPAALDAIIRRCLEKDPAQRFQSAADLAFALRSVTNLSMSQAVVAARKTGSRRWVAYAAGAIGALVLVAAGYLLRARLSATAPPEFQRMTFREGRVLSARLGPDGRNVLYTANWDGADSRVYLATPGTPESRDLELPQMRLLAVSSTGDLALLKGPIFPDGSGTLTRGSIGGGQTRDLLDHVVLADFSPDGAEMAVVRRVDGKGRLEYPVGTVVAETSWGPFAIRVSPDGRRVAFSTYLGSGSRIGIYLAERGGKSKPLGIVSAQTRQVDDSQLCWSADGKEIWFRSFDESEPNTVYAMGLDGKRRMVTRFPGQVTLYDVGADGRMLFSSDPGHTGIRGVAPGESTERDLSCLETSELRGISADGQTILANVLGASGGEKGSIYLRRTDGSPPIRLGDGVGFGMSTDGKWVSGYSSRAATSRKYILMPTGAGETVEVKIPGVQGTIIGWLPGTENYLVGGWSKAENYWHLLTWNARTQSVKSITKKIEDSRILISPDGRQVAVECAADDWCVYPIEGGEPHHLSTLTAHEQPVGWRDDNRSVYVVTHHDRNDFLRISLFDTESGKRTSWKEIHPTIAVDEARNPVITPDGRAYAYSYSVVRSQLYVAGGIK
jgi:Tol biopolymer transport system component